MKPERRALLVGGVAAGVGMLGGLSGVAAGKEPLLAAQTQWTPPPPQAPVTEGVQQLPDVKLWYWDTGGRGEPIVLLHAFTGSATAWSYQQPVFARAGYRVVAYSRRGHRHSETGPLDRTGSASGDLQTLVDALKIDRFHFVGTAAGGFVGPDFALSHPERLLSMTLASTQGGATDPDYRAALARVLPQSFRDLPSDLREVGPAYRVANPEGLELWKEQEQLSVEGRPRVTQTPVHDLTWENIGKIKVPTQMFTGDADLYMPPPLARLYASKIRGCETAFIAEAGHALFWEQPDAFNRLVLDFVRRHRRR
jgi:pimeloyl-ACP methyl ester carboxylesterase